MIDEYEYRFIKNLIRKATNNMDNFTTIGSDELSMNVNGYVSRHPIGIKDKTTGIDIHERALVHFNNYKMLNRAFSYLYYEIVEKDVRDEIRKIGREQELRTDFLIKYLNN